MSSGIGFVDILFSEIAMIVGALIFLFCGAVLIFKRKSLNNAQKGLAVIALIIAGLYGTFVIWLAAMWGGSGPKEAKPTVSYSVYIPNSNADGFDMERVETEEVSAEMVLAELKERDVIPDAVAVKGFRMDGGVIAVDFNQAFADALSSMGSSGEGMIIGSVVNTFLDAFQAETVYFTVEGRIFESGHETYDFGMTVVSLEPQPAE